MLGFKRIGIATVLALALVLCLQPVYFLVMTNLDRIISHERTWQHIGDAFEAGVLEPGYHSRNQFIDSGDRFTDCATLGMGLQPGVPASVEGITAPRPTATSDNHPCDDLKAAAADPTKVVWIRTERYWNGARVFSAPLASLVPILALKLINLAVLVIISVVFVIQSARLLGAGATIGLFAPVLFCCDYVRIWHVTPHTVSTAVILGGGAMFAAAVRGEAGLLKLVLLSALCGSVFNFVDLLVNPPWMPMLLAFFVMTMPAPITQRQKLAVALLCVGAWFSAYAVTWFFKWVFDYVVDPAFDVRSDVLTTMAFRLDGDYGKVVHIPLFPSLKTFGAAIATWGLPLFACFVLVVGKALKGRAFDRRAFFWLAWPVLIPIVWFETLSNHTQIHTMFVIRSAAAAIGVVAAAALMAADITREDLVGHARQLFARQPASQKSPPAA
jgi:hypothetical protein